MKKTTLALIALLSSGCFGTTKLDYSLAGQQKQMFQRGYESKTTTHNWFYGLIDGDSVLMGAACGQRGVSSIRVEQGFMDWALFCVTFGIYDRTTVVFTCE